MPECEVSNGQDSVKLVASGYERPEVQDGYDANWVTSEVHVQVGPFSGSYRASFLTFDFRRFADSVKSMVERGTGEAAFSSDEDWLNLQLSIGTTGAVAVHGVARSQKDAETRLEFAFETDLTFVQRIHSQLQSLVSELPAKPLE